MIAGFTKRTTFVVRDAEAAAAFYRDVFGWEVWYDNRLPVDARFPPCAPDAAPARLILLKAHDPKIGMVGFLAYEDFAPEDTPGFAARPRVRLGDAILVLEADDLEAVHARAVAAGARVVSPPARWSVPGPDGRAIELFAMGMFDPNGIYSETSRTRR